MRDLRLDSPGGRAFAIPRLVALLLMACVSGCGSGQREHVEFGNGFDFYFDSNAMESQSMSLVVTNPYELDVSPNRRFAVFSNVTDRNAPEVYLRDDRSVIRRITNNEFNEAYPVVNDVGDYAYAQFADSVSSAAVVLNDQPISELNDTAVTAMDITDHLLAVAYIGSDDSGHIALYDIGLRSLSEFSVPGPVQEVRFLTGSSMVIEVFDIGASLLRVMLYDAATGNLQSLSGADSAFFEQSSNGGVAVHRVSGQGDSLLLFWALRSWREHQIAHPFAYANNFLGRLSWNESRLLEGLIALYRVQPNRVFLDQIRRHVNAVLAGTNRVTLPNDPELPPYLWATRKYSLDKSTPLDLLVDDARVLYPLLVAANAGMLDVDARATIIDSARRAFDYFEQDYDPGARLYRIRYGTAFQYDGVLAPYNWQNMFALVLLELYKATGDNVYRDRVEQLAMRFRSEWVTTSDGRRLWHYWPGEFYRGWTAADGVSTNTTARVPKVDSLYEDTSHASLNVKFVLEYRRAFGSDIFTDDDMAGLRATLEHLSSSGGFSSYLSGLPEGSAARVPLYAWAELRQEDIETAYEKSIPRRYPVFNSMTDITSYAWAIGSTPHDEVAVCTTGYGPDLQPGQETCKTLRPWQMLGFFGLIPHPTHPR